MKILPLLIVAGALLLLGAGPPPADVTQRFRPALDHVAAQNPAWERLRQTRVWTWTHPHCVYTRAALASLGLTPGASANVRFNSMCLYTKSTLDLSNRTVWHEAAHLLLDQSDCHMLGIQRELGAWLACIHEWEHTALTDRLYTTWMAVGIAREWNEHRACEAVHGVSIRCPPPWEPEPR